MTARGNFPFALVEAHATSGGTRFSVSGFSAVSVVSAPVPCRPYPKFPEDPLFGVARAVRALLFLVTSFLGMTAWTSLLGSEPLAASDLANSLHPSRGFHDLLKVREVLDLHEH